MFTGIVKEIGAVKEVRADGAPASIAITATTLAKDAAVGDSIAVSGVCLTVIGIKGNVLTFDAVRETLARTTLGMMRAGAAVNLETALGASDSLGGHFVTGHIDCVGTVSDVRRSTGDVEISVAYPGEFAGLIVEKGSVALDGTSLTVAAVRKGGFTVHVIPHTSSVTTLGRCRPGTRFNIEFDLIGKYVARAVESVHPVITEKFLRDKGFA